MTEVCHGAVQGDVQIIPDWKKSHTLDQLKAIVEENGYSAVTVAGNNEFGHAAGISGVDTAIAVIQGRDMRKNKGARGSQ